MEWNHHENSQAYDNYSHHLSWEVDNSIIIIIIINVASEEKTMSEVCVCVGGGGLGEGEVF